MRQHFQAEQWLPYPLELVFAFFANPANLPRLTPAWQRARLDRIELKPAPPPPESTVRPHIAAGDGTKLTLSLRPFPLLPVRLSWEARIEDFRWNVGFADVQLRGPFHYWRQRHLMQASASATTGAPGTLLKDEIEYVLPLGALGALADSLAVRRQIAALFRFRHQRTLELLPSFAAHIGYNPSSQQSHHCGSE